MDLFDKRLPEQLPAGLRLLAPDTPDGAWVTTGDEGTSERYRARWTFDEADPRTADFLVELTGRYTWNPAAGLRTARGVGEHVIGIKLTMAERAGCDRACVQRDGDDWHVQAFAGEELLGEWWTGGARNHKIRSSR